MSTCFFSSIFLMMLPLSRSMVRVEEEAITSEDRVDMDADSTRMTTTAIRRGGSPDSICGMIASKPSLATSTSNSLPKPPRK